MGKNKDVSQDLHERIVELHNEGLEYRKISAQLCVPIASVETTIRKWKCRNTTLSKPRTGRPRKINDRPARKLILTLDHILDHIPYHIPDHIPYHIPDHIPDHILDHILDHYF
ncbi:Homeobox domain-like [Trinorchestia longiramus]|nr:Homeobox domain-like [Trinorchestia longiramus]